MEQDSRLCEAPKVPSLQEAFESLPVRLQTAEERMAEALGFVPSAPNASFARLPGDPPLVTIDKIRVTKDEVTYRVTYCPGRLVVYQERQVT